MKLFKEYPATHSMDAAWFVEDLDGNIAIFQFEENGPGPIPFTDVHTDEIIPKLGVQAPYYSIMPFTEEQIEDLKTGLKPVTSVEDIRIKCNILINPAKIRHLIGLGAKFDLCYSEKQGFYHLNYWDCDHNVIKELIDNGDIYGAQECDIEIFFMDDRKDQSEHRLAHFPFYVYEQQYVNVAPERVVVPKYPLKVEQMLGRAKQYLFKLPVRFAEKEHIEPAEFIDSQCWLFTNHTKEVNGVKYMQVALTDGGYGYVKVMPYSDDQPELTEEWKSAPRVIDKSDEYYDRDDVEVITL